VDSKDAPDRLNTLEQMLKKNERRGTRLCWIRWDPNSAYGFQIDDAREEVRWMIYEIKRLREENAELKAFADAFRESLEGEIKRK
jgi:superfamily I DNA/RNA helicase